jgi:hypothetical protein
LRATRIFLVGTALVIAAMTGALRTVPAGAVNAQLAFSPTASSVGVGATVNVDITIASVTDLGGYDLALQFNPARVHLVAGSFTDSGFVVNPPSGNLVTCVVATINNSAGTATETCTTLLSSVLGPPVPGTGVTTTTARALMRAQFTGVTTGVASLTITGTTLQGPTGIDIPVSLGTGSITVTAAQSVGGIAEQPDVAALPSATASSGRDYTPGIVAVVVFLAAAGAAVWRRRRT